MNVYYVFSVNKPQFCCPFHGDAAAYTSGHTNFFQRLRVTLSLSSSIIYISSDIQHVVVDGHMVFVLPFDFDMFFFVSPIDVFSFTGGNRCQFPSDGRGVRSPAFIHAIQIQVVCLIRRSGRLNPISFRQMIHRVKMRIHDISDGNA